MASARMAVVGMMVLALTAGCGGSTPAPAPTDVAVYDASGGGPGGLAALLAGTLERVDGCVVVRGDGIDMAKDVEYVPVFPLGVHWDGDALVVQGTKYRLGEHVQFGGGTLSEESASTLAAELPVACAGRQLWLISAQ
ncbi:hypothetical protein DDP54_01515 [Cellulomonas sp. WB94]|nr:hypothetical protein DDP54_01515 [Cellulomonas sp. WB94]